MEIALMKLVSGEEVIAKVTENTENTLTIKNARVLIMQPTGPGQVGLVMVPWMATVPDDEIPLRKVDIMHRATNVPKELEDGYLQQTSGIQLATGL